MDLTLKMRRMEHLLIYRLLFLILRRRLIHISGVDEHIVTLLSPRIEIKVLMTFFVIYHPALITICPLASTADFALNLTAANKHFDSFQVFWASATSFG